MKKIIITLITSIIAINFAYADTDIVNNPQESVNREYTIHLDEPTIAKGYTVSAFEDNLKLSLVPGILNEDTNVDVIELNEEMDMPWQVDRISNVYQFEFRNKSAYDNYKPFYIQFAYDTSTNYHKQVFFYDKNFASWRPLPTRDFPNEKFVRSLIHLPFARIAVFSNSEAMTIGRASWYKYKGGDFAASPDFPKGSRVRVHNDENGKFVDVVINDWGPERDIFPDRVIDLDKVAFSKLASTGAGVIDVRVEPINIVKASNKILNISDSGIGATPNITAKSAVAINEKTNEIILEKNATTTLPLASLTKLVAIKTFLETRPSLDRVVIYSSQDEEYNYEWCSKWESARLKVAHGDSITVEDLLYASLVGSANNAIETLVRVSGMPRNDFIKKNE
ncbi:MAG: RlpA-like double-psi beta-barrel domain-containing protein [Candidatus Falkowbacteria bacterium]